MTEHALDRDLIQRRLRTLIKAMEALTRDDPQGLTVREAKEWARQYRTYVDLTDDELLS